MIDEEGPENCGLDVVLVEADRPFFVAEKWVSGR